MKLLFYLSKQLDTVQGVIEECAWGDMGFQWQTGDVHSGWQGSQVAQGMCTWTDRGSTGDGRRNTGGDRERQGIFKGFLSQLCYYQTWWFMFCEVNKFFLQIKGNCGNTFNERNIYEKSICPMNISVLKFCWRKLLSVVYKKFGMCLDRKWNQIYITLFFSYGYHHSLQVRYFKKMHTVFIS